MELSGVILTLITFLLAIVNFGNVDARREIKYSDQWNRENFIQHDFYTPDINEEPKDQGVSLELLRAKLEELMNEETQEDIQGDGRSTILSNIRGRPITLQQIRDRNKERQRQGLIQLIWEWLFGTGTATTTTTASPSDGNSGSGSGSGGSGSGNDGSGSGNGGSGSGSSGSSPDATTAPPNRTRRPTKYKNRGYCKNPPKKHLPENDVPEEDSKLK